MSLYFTLPITRPAIWGGERLAHYFGFREMQGQIGQAWAFSCQKENESPLADTQGTLGDLWREKPELFQSRYDAFPFIISLVAPVQDLSIQIHPNDAQAQQNGYANGKNEAWVFLQAPDSGTIIYGQTAGDVGKLRKMAQAEQWEQLIGRLKVQQGDFVYVPAGMLHALTGGCIAYEVQQATDVTYRFYDYHRKDAQGKERPLHIEQAIACLDFSLGTANAAPVSQTLETPSATVTTYLQNNTFCIRRLDIHGKQSLRFPNYQLATVAVGEGLANGKPIATGDSFLLPAMEPLTVEGTVTLMTTCE